MVSASDPSYFLQVQTHNAVNGLDYKQVLPGVSEQSSSSQCPMKEEGEYKE